MSKLYGVLSASSGRISFRPGAVTRRSFRLSGDLVHTGTQVVAVSHPFGSLTIGLRADDAQSTLILRPVFGRAWPLRYINVRLLPWQRERAMQAIAEAGFVVSSRRRWLPRPVIRPLR